MAVIDINFSIQGVLETFKATSHKVVNQNGSVKLGGKAAKYILGCALI